MPDQKMEKERFKKRLSTLYQFWQKNQELKSADAILIVNGKEDIVYSKTISVHMWLFGYELQETAIAFCREAVHILSGKKKIEFLSPAAALGGSDGLPKIVLHTRDVGDNDKANFVKLVKAVEASGKGKTIGHFAKDKFKSDFVTDCLNAIKAKNMEQVDVSGSFGELLAVKDSIETDHLKSASGVTCKVFKSLKEKILEIIDNDRKNFKHSKLAAYCEDALKDKTCTAGVDKDQLEMCYQAIVQSGGQFSLKFSTESNDSPLHFGVIVCSVGVRYHSYCSNVIRTFLVNPTEEQTAAYTYLSDDLYKFTMGEIKDGVRFSDLYAKIESKVAKDKPELKDKLVKSFGFVTGIEFRDGSMVIMPKSPAVFRKGMSINFNLGLQDMKNPHATEKKDESYALWLGDVLVVGEGEGNNSPANLTSECKCRAKAITFLIKEDAEDEEEDVDMEESGRKREGRGAADKPEELLGRGMRGMRTILDQKTRNEQTAEDKRMIHQRELYEKLLQDSSNRLMGMHTDTESGKKTKSNVAYKGAGQMPKEDDISRYRIVVDKKYETVVLPIFGQPIPFHISMVKNISTSSEGDYTYLRINLFHPGVAINVKDTTPFQGAPHQNAGVVYLKELTFRASNLKPHGEVSAPATNLNTAHRLIKEVQKKFRTREAEEREMADLVQQDTLIPVQKNGPKLKDLYIRPNIVSKRIIGSLEAHTNGLRFTSIRGDQVDIMYNNIKHAFYQSCDKEMIILLHFHLVNAIVYGKKRHQDIQFYTEVGEITTDLGKSHYMRDRDDLESEQQERELRNKLKTAFETFKQRTEALSTQAIEFEETYRDLGFIGCPHRSTVLLQPTSSCLVQLTEWPPLVVTLEEVEFVFFERVQLSIRNFDIVFVFKDYKKKHAMITSVPSTSLDHVKEWLNSCDLLYAEGVNSMNWVKIMKTILDDPEGFLEGGGWAQILPIDTDDKAASSSSDDENDGAYVPSESSVEAGSGSDEESSESGGGDDEDWSAEESSGSEEELDSDESEGLDWDELEEKARKEDARRNSDEDVDDRHQNSKKRPHSGDHGGSSAKKAKHGEKRSSGDHKGSSGKAKKGRR